MKNIYLSVVSVAILLLSSTNGVADANDHSAVNRLLQSDQVIFREKNVVQLTDEDLWDISTSGDVKTYKKDAQISLLEGLVVRSENQGIQSVTEVGVLRHGDDPYASYSGKDWEKVSRVHRIEKNSGVFDTIANCNMPKNQCVAVNVSICRDIEAKVGVENFQNQLFAHKGDVAKFSKDFSASVAKLSNVQIGKMKQDLSSFAARLGKTKKGENVAALLDSQQKAVREFKPRPLKLAAEAAVDEVLSMCLQLVDAGHSLKATEQAKGSKTEPSAVVR